MKPLTVLAMHRSGTSLIASYLEKCGLRMVLDRRMGAAVGNEVGHFEDLDFVKLHERSISRQVRRSWGWKTRSGHSLHFDEEELRRALEMISAREALGTPWGWKDPRTLLFAQDWKLRMPHLQALVLCRSGPRVIDSLVARSQQKNVWQGAKIGYVEACTVNKAHNLLLLKYVSAHSRDVFGCSIEALIHSDGEELLDKIENHCDVRLARVSFKDVFDARMLNQSKPSLRSRLLFKLSGGPRLARRLMKLLPPLFNGGLD